MAAYWQGWNVQEIKYLSTMKYSNMREEELKNRVAQEYFSIYDCTNIIGNVDFCVRLKQTDTELFEQESLIWAEAKTGCSDVYNSITQLVLTIGKARTFDKCLPPPMLGAFDGEKIAFIPYSSIHGVFYINDFNWNVTPSDHTTKEFQLIRSNVKSILDKQALLFNYENDDRELKKFIRANFVVGRLGITKTRIDKNNFVVIYNKWLKTVKKTIIVNWEIAQRKGIIDGDFYLADLLSLDNVTLKDKLYVVLNATKYILNRHQDEYGAFTSSTVEFNDSQVAHTQFWNHYERPPKEEYWDYIVERRDLLVPQDIRERRGSYFTPQNWVELSQKYLTSALGEDWQDEYYIWDCAAGTGNLLHGLVKKYNIWASTLDDQDVEVMHDRIRNGANLIHDHVFQFDFLNDDFSKLPQPLQDIINDPEKRRKLVVYLNPPYAEVSSVGEKGKAGVNLSRAHDKYADRVGTAGREIYIFFLSRIYHEIDGCIIGEFSKLKALQGAAFDDFRNFFRAELLNSFVVPAYTFDNVKGNFPIGFKVWNTANKVIFKSTVSDVYDENGVYVGLKEFSVTDQSSFINKWISAYRLKKQNNYIGFLAGTNGNDFQQNGIVYILNRRDQMANPRGIWINKDNLLAVSVYFAVRKCINQTWLNDRDQFLCPNESWKTDTEFQNDCFIYTLFSNGIRSSEGTNHWIPFSEDEVNARDKFESDFMSRYIHGRLRHDGNADLFGLNTARTTPLEFSKEAQSVINSGRELWIYYHQQPGCNVDASLYEIREFFQGRDDTGKMNPRSDNETYTALIGEVRRNMRILIDKIGPKVYEHGFLKA